MGGLANNRNGTRIATFDVLVGMPDPWANLPFYPEVDSVGGSLETATSLPFRAFDFFLIAFNGLTRRAAAR